MHDPHAELLQLKANAGLDEIKRAYRKAALAHHPDHNPHPEAARHFRRLTEAYRVLEARAASQHPLRPRKEVSLGDRVSFVLGDVKALLRRWPADRWNQAVDGLPAAVWVASVLDVLASPWPGPTAQPVVPTPEGLALALEAWSQRCQDFPLPPLLPRDQARALTQAIAAAEKRLKALDRPSRKPSR